MEIKTDILIIGAGLTGLTTGYYLNKAGKNLMIIDKQGRAGGVIKTCQEDGFTYECGPNTGVLSDVAMEDLFAELEGDCELEPADTHKANKRYVVKNGKLIPLPTGPIGGLLTPLFSWRDKFFGIPLEPFRKRGTNPDETLAELVKRRMGESMLDYAIDPFILGVYAGDPNQLVPKYALPKLYNLEQDYGSFIGGAIKKMIASKRKGERSPSRKIFSFKGGLENMVKAMETRIGTEKFILGLEGIQVNQNPEGGFTVTAEQNDEPITIKTEKVVTACGSYTLPGLLSFIDDSTMCQITDCHYTKVIEVQLGFNKWEGRALDGFGGLCPFKENRDILGILFMSATQSGRAPEGGALLTVFIGGVRRQDLITLSDNEIKELLAREVGELMEMPEFKPDLIKIQRHEHAIPQYGAESAKRFKAVEKAEKQFPGLILGGNFTGGIGMSKRVVQGTEIAKRLI